MNTQTKPKRGRGRPRKTDLSNEYVKALEQDVILSDEKIKTLEEMVATQKKIIEIDVNQIRMLEAEVDRQNDLIDALIKAIKVIERG